MENVRQAIQRALNSQAGLAWDDVDHLAAEAVRKGFSTLDELKTMISLALVRSGHEGSNPHFSDDEWPSMILAAIFKKLETCSTLQAQFASIPTAVHSIDRNGYCLLYTSPSPRDQRGSRMPSSA